MIIYVRRCRSRVIREDILEALRLSFTIMLTVRLVKKAWLNIGVDLRLSIRFKYCHWYMQNVLTGHTISIHAVAFIVLLSWKHMAGFNKEKTRYVNDVCGIKSKLSTSTISLHSHNSLIGNDVVDFLVLQIYYLLRILLL